jgi:hypothetical protein
MTRTLAVEWAAHRIRVVAVAPGPFDSKGAADRLWPSEELAERVRRAIPFERFATREEVAGACAWLVSDDASYVTGECLTMDGGASLGRGFLGGGERVASVKRRKDRRDDLRTKIVAALVFAALVPMAVVIAIRWGKPRSGAGEQTAKRRASARAQASSSFDTGAHRRARRRGPCRPTLASDRTGSRPSLGDPRRMRGLVAPARIALPGFDRLEVLDASGAVLASLRVPTDARRDRPL